MIGLHSFSLFQLERYFQRLKNPKLRVSLLRSLRLPSAFPLPLTTAPSGCLSMLLMDHSTFIEYMNINLRVPEVWKNESGFGAFVWTLWPGFGAGAVVGGRVEAAVAGSRIHHHGAKQLPLLDNCCLIMSPQFCCFSLIGHSRLAHQFWYTVPFCLACQHW